MRLPRYPGSLLGPALRRRADVELQKLRARRPRQTAHLQLPESKATKNLGEAKRVWLRYEGAVMALACISGLAYYLTHIYMAERFQDLKRRRALVEHHRQLCCMSESKLRALQASFEFMTHAGARCSTLSDERRTMHDLVSLQQQLRQLRDDARCTPGTHASAAADPGPTTHACSAVCSAAPRPVTSSGSVPEGVPPAEAAHPSAVRVSAFGSTGGSGMAVGPGSQRHWGTWSLAASWPLLALSRLWRAATGRRVCTGHAEAAEGQLAHTARALEHWDEMRTHCDDVLTRLSREYQAEHQLLSRQEQHLKHCEAAAPRTLMFDSGWHFHRDSHLPAQPASEATNAPQRSRRVVRHVAMRVWSSRWLEDDQSDM